MKILLLAIALPIATAMISIAIPTGKPSETSQPSDSKTPPHCRYCTPSEDGTCTACKNCKYCGHCNASAGNTCSICN